MSDKQLLALDVVFFCVVGIVIVLLTCAGCELVQVYMLGATLHYRTVCSAVQNVARLIDMAYRRDTTLILWPRPSVPVMDAMDMFGKVVDFYESVRDDLTEDEVQKINAALDLMQNCGIPCYNKLIARKQKRAHQN